MILFPVSSVALQERPIDVQVWVQLAPRAPRWYCGTGVGVTDGEWECVGVDDGEVK